MVWFVVMEVFSALLEWVRWRQKSEQEKHLKDSAAASPVGYCRTNVGQTGPAVAGRKIDDGGFVFRQVRYAL